MYRKTTRWTCALALAGLQAVVFPMAAKAAPTQAQEPDSPAFSTEAPVESQQPASREDRERAEAAARAWGQPPPAGSEAAPATAPVPNDPQRDATQNAQLLKKKELPPACIPSTATQPCKDALRPAADALQSHGTKNVVIGSILAGVGLVVLVPAGFLGLKTYETRKEAEDDCEASGGDCSDLPDPGMMLILGAVSTAFGIAFTAGGAVVLASGAGEISTAKRVRRDHHLTLAPAFGRGFAGVRLGFRM